MGLITVSSGDIESDIDLKVRSPFVPSPLPPEQLDDFWYFFVRGLAFFGT